MFEIPHWTIPENTTIDVSGAAGVVAELDGVARLLGKESAFSRRSPVAHQCGLSSSVSPRRTRVVATVDSRAWSP